MATQKHQCPRPGCTKEIDNRIFCCAPDWFALGVAARKGIYNTAKLSLLVPERRAAIEACMADWRASAGRR